MENYKTSFRKQQKRNFQEFRLVKKSVDVIPKAQSIKEKTETWNHIKI